MSNEIIEYYKNEIKKIKSHPFFRICESMSEGRATNVIHASQKQRIIIYQEFIEKLEGVKQKQ